jgi:hypothetical protein
MGREVRRVIAGWTGMYDDSGQQQPHFDKSFRLFADEWKRELAKWNPDNHDGEEYWEWKSNPPNRKYCRPDWKPEEMTHYQLYENVSEGTPISPAFGTIEELARWYADNGDPVHGKALDYNQALRFLLKGWAPSCAFTEHGPMGGPEFIATYN